MPSDIKIPALGESVAGGQIAKWHFKEGDLVKTGDVLLTLETDKVAAEVTAESSGALHIGKQAGEDVEVGGVVGQIDENASAPAAKAEAPKPAPAASAPAPAAKAEPEKPANVTEFKVVPKPGHASSCTCGQGCTGRTYHAQEDEPAAQKDCGPARQCAAHRRHPHHVQRM